jgi:hypothetical protein
MTRYELPELLEVGAIEQVVFGTGDFLKLDNPAVGPHSPQIMSALDFD